MEMKKGIAILLADAVITYLNLSTVTSVDLDKRIQKGRRLCHKITAELKLNFSEKDFAEGADYYKKAYVAENAKPTDIWKRA